MGRQQLHSFMGSTYQTLSIGSGCEYKGIVMHEMMHVAGFWHEQSRPGRNEHIEVLWENVIVGMESLWYPGSTRRLFKQTALATSVIPYTVVGSLSLPTTVIPCAKPN